MKAYYLNKYIDSSNCTYYDLILENEDGIALRLSGVTFETCDNNVLINRAIEIIQNNFPDETLENIYIGYGDSPLDSIW